MYALNCTYTPLYTANPDGTYRQNPWLKVTDEYIPDGDGGYYWEGRWQYDTFSYEIPGEYMNGTLKEAVNTPSTFELKIYRSSIPKEEYYKTPVNREYFPDAVLITDDSHWENIDAYRTSCSLYEKDELIFEGRFNSVEDCMDSDGKIYKLVTCESQLAYLGDIVIDANEIREMLGDNAPTLYNIANAIVRCHNEYNGGFAGNVSKEFVLNFIDFNTGVNDYSYTLDGNSPDSPLNWLKKIFVNELGGYIWVSHNTALKKEDDGYLVLNIAPSYGIQQSKKQTITLGQNMKSLTVRSAYNESGNITHYVPYGGVGTDGKRLMLRHVKQRVYGGTGNIVMRSVQNGALANSYGTIEEPIIYDDLVDDGQQTAEQIEQMENTMLSRTQVQAKQLDNRITSIEVSAYDLYYAGYDVEKLTVGVVYHLANDLLTFEGDFMLLSKEIEIGKPWGGKLTFGSGFGSGLRKMTGQTADRFLTINKRMHNIERTITNRFDGGSFKLNGSDGALTQAEFDSMLEQHNADPDKMLIRPNAFYFPEQPDGATVHAYKGTKRIELGGGGGSIEYAAVIAEQERSRWIPEHELISVFYSSGCAAYYGGAPARMIIQGQRVLFNVPYEDIKPDDIYSDVEFLNPDGSRLGATAYVSAQTADTMTITVARTQNGVTQYNNYTSFTLDTTDIDISKLTFGVVLDFQKIYKYTSAGMCGYVEQSFTTQIGGRVYNLVCAAFEGDRLLEFSGAGDGGSTGALPYLYIYDESEWHFDIGCTQRYEAEVL